MGGEHLQRVLDYFEDNKVKIIKKSGKWEELIYPKNHKFLRCYIFQY